MRAQNLGDNKMIRLASVGDAGELERLNAEFNGKGKTTEESYCAFTNRREIVIVADGNGGRSAFCVQLKNRSATTNICPR